ncbi:unnamed protein product [Chrysoparadoxa australica]
MQGILTACSLSWPAFFTCCSHAMTTEHHEVMGVLLGHWEEEGSRVVIEHVWVLQRTDKRKDRVEVNWEQLLEVSQRADAASKANGKEFRVVGWYHSHPHITVLPSHVDAKVHSQHQQSDSRWLGLIFAVFQTANPELEGKIEATAFQSSDNSKEGYKQIPLVICPPSPSQSCVGLPLSDAFQELIRLQETLFKEERDQKPSDCSGRISFAEDVYNSAIYQQGLASLLSVSSTPLLHALRCRVECMRRQEDELKEIVEKERGKLTPTLLKELNRRKVEQKGEKE